MLGLRRDRPCPLYTCPHEGCVRRQDDFLRKNDLYQHYLIHIECNAACNACDMQFTSLAALIRHANSCGNDFFNSSSHDAKSMVDLIVSCRRKLDEHVNDRANERHTICAPKKCGRKKKSRPLNKNHHGGQKSHGRVKLLLPKASPGSKPDIEIIDLEAIQENNDDQSGSRISEPTNMPNCQPHRWIPDHIMSELNSTGRSTQKVHRFEDYTCPHGECSTRKKDWRSKDKLLKHYYSHFSCAVICNACNRNICNLDSLVMHPGWCKGFLFSSPRAATIRSELMKSCEERLGDRLAERFEAGLAVGEQEAHNENSKPQWKYLMSCAMNPKLPFPDHNLSKLQALPDTNTYFPSEDLPASLSGAKSNGPEGLQLSCNCDLALLPKNNTSSALHPNYGGLPELQQSSGCFYYDVENIPVPPFQRGSQQSNLTKIHQPTRDTSVPTRYSNDSPLVTNQQALPVDVSSFDRASFDSVVNTGPSFYSQWPTELCEPQTVNRTDLSRALMNLATNFDPDSCLLPVNNACNAVPGGKSPMNQAQLPPPTDLDIDSFLSSLAIPTDRSMCVPAAPDMRNALVSNQTNLNGAYSSSLMDPTFGFLVNSSMACNCALPHPLQACNCALQHPLQACNCALQHPLQARSFAPTCPTLDHSMVRNQVNLNGGNNGVTNQNNYRGWY